MTERSPFLTAVWSNLCLVTYPVEPDLLESRLPDELELDTIDGTAFVSLVAFDFLQTEVKGVAWPGFVNFPEINLRFYVEETGSGRRGVMFVRELVPSRLVAGIARTLYNEPYTATPMRSSVHRYGELIEVEHRWKWRGASYHLRVESSAEAHLPAEDTPEHFFKEHQWGYGVSLAGRTLVYEVRHPHWSVHEVRDLELGVDFGHLYGEEFAPLNDREPVSIVHAVGSPVEVFGHSKL